MDINIARRAESRRAARRPMSAAAVLASLTAFALAGCVPGAEESAATVTTPAPTATEDAPTPTALAASTEEFCALLLEVRELDDSISPESDRMYAAIQAAETMDDPEALAAAQAWAQALLDMVEPSMQKYEQAKALTDDPELLAGLDVTIRVNDELTVPMTERILAAKSYGEVNDILLDLNEQAAASVTAQDAQAIQALNNYSLDVCGFALREQ